MDISMDMSRDISRDISMDISMNISPGTWYHVPGTMYLVPGTRYKVPGTVAEGTAVSGKVPVSGKVLRRPVTDRPGKR